MSDTDINCGKCGELLTSQIPTVECGSSCHECGKYSYRADQLSYLYLLTHEQLKLHKIGIGTVGKDKGRLQQLINDGWMVHGIWHNSDKRKTFHWEAATFKELAKVIPANSSKTLGLVGRRDRHWVESVGADVITVSALAQLISKIISGQ
jgi:hypothetical protein